MEAGECRAGAIRRSFPLHQVQELVADGQYDITDTARRDAESLTFDEFDIVECISALIEVERYSHTLRSSAKPGQDQDVYLIRMHGFPLYIKVRIDDWGRVVVISFKRDESI